MKYILILLLLTLASCESPDHYGVAVGDVVTLQSGFFKGCMGTITEYRHFDDFDDDIIDLQDVTCKNATIHKLSTAAKSLKKK